MPQTHIRNFCIIAHIDHGKSTLADRLLQNTGTIESNNMVEQLLDSMDLERERGITIKAQAVRMKYTSNAKNNYQLNLIDTPGHVDFSYEVSRSLAACEGALLVVDSTQGIQAQTMANVLLALDNGLEIIPIVNKIDLDVADPERISEEIQKTFGFLESEIIFASAKDGRGIDNILEAIVKRIPCPEESEDLPLQALIFDAKYDPYKGVIAYVRVYQGSLDISSRIQIMSTKIEGDCLEIGYFNPNPTKLNKLETGEVGYIATGLKNITNAPVGDTITLAGNPANKPLPGYMPLKPMVFAGFYPADGEDYLSLRDAIEKLKLNDAALSYQLETSMALGNGFRCGFLGLLHMDIVQERLEREYGINLIATSPSVAYEIELKDASSYYIDNPAQLPELTEIQSINEPWLNLRVLTPMSYIGGVMELIKSRRGVYKNMDYLNSASGDSNSTARALIDCEIPLSEVLIDFYDQLKAISQGYASMDYSLLDYRQGHLIKLDILVGGDIVDALSIIVHKDKSYQFGRSLVSTLKDLIPRQLFEVPVQATIGNKIIARETIKALRKNVLAKCYGGDITRKRKLLQQQAEGKKRMKKVGRVDIPQEAFLSILKLNR
ncbi:MAG: elongation factor 4 [Chloroflexi bacterium]|nr:elongation factor 4 [Chloroflexota bacterium]MCH2304783.1 translation elongation factor 4 [SAR202 cluster bacterium]|tara:strand:- start:4248 stop:6071 length:1824 start_codon:yes stop_codon:yes gene_type:complete